MACGSADAHLNPAVTIGARSLPAISASSLPYQRGATGRRLRRRLAGVAALLPHWRETPDADRNWPASAPRPAIRSPLANLVSEIIGTFVLVLVASAIGSKAVAATGPAAGLGPYLVGAWCGASA